MTLKEKIVEVLKPPMIMRTNEMIADEIIQSVKAVLIKKEEEV